MKTKDKIIFYLWILNVRYSHWKTRRICKKYKISVADVDEWDCLEAIVFANNSSLMLARLDYHDIEIKWLEADAEAIKGINDYFNEVTNRFYKRYDNWIWHIFRELVDRDEDQTAVYMNDHYISWDIYARKLEDVEIEYYHDTE